MVRDHARGYRGGGCATGGAGGDGGRRGKVAVARIAAVWAGQGPARWFGDAPPAAGAVRGGAAFVDRVHGDAGRGGLVLQDGDGAADLPLAQPQVVPPARILVQDTAGVADGRGGDPVGDRPADDGVGGLVPGLADAAAVPALCQPGAAAGLAPPASRAARVPVPVGRPPAVWLWCRKGASGARPGWPARTPAAPARRGRPPH